MRVYTYSEAKQRLSEILDVARNEEVVIRRRGGEVYSVALKNMSKSPFDVQSIHTNATTQDILDALRDSRSSISEQ
ncbi:MAG: type II toxin-antitoxin system prevent-host-death family antitoxin [SAR324 cluster bacterium]|nr:type II toxin-antitoxin system prevent-host-death family antitoxin [SAR324 cluster bacterium]